MSYVYLLKFQTIIECLKCIITGDMPPNSNKGRAFVHDPKIAGSGEVKGQIKLQFKDTTKQEVVCSRSIQSTRKVCWHLVAENEKQHQPPLTNY